MRRRRLLNDDLLLENVRVLALVHRRLVIGWRAGRAVRRRRVARDAAGAGGQRRRLLDDFDERRRRRRAVVGDRSRLDGVVRLRLDVMRHEAGTLARLVVARHRVVRVALLERLQLGYDLLDDVNLDAFTLRQPILLCMCLMRRLALH